jgi:hypothetical protein
MCPVDARSESKPACPLQDEINRPLGEDRREKKEK